MTSPSTSVDRADPARPPRRAGRCSRRTGRQGSPDHGPHGRRDAARVLTSGQRPAQLAREEGVARAPTDARPAPHRAPLRLRRPWTRARSPRPPSVPPGDQLGRHRQLRQHRGHLGPRLPGAVDADQQQPSPPGRRTRKRSRSRVDRSLHWRSSRTTTTVAFAPPPGSSMRRRRRGAAPGLPGPRGSPRTGPASPAENIGRELRRDLQPGSARPTSRRSASVHGHQAGAIWPSQTGAPEHDRAVPVDLGGEPAQQRRSCRSRSRR